MAIRRIPTEEEIEGYMTSLSNWGRWGADDDLGTLNLITPEKTAQATRLVKEGISVSCSRLILHENAADVPTQFQHFMITTGEAAPSSGIGSSGEYIGMAIHGHTITHIDCPCHTFWDSKMYNGKPASLVTTAEKATVGGVQNLQNGVITRGVLLDIPRLRGKEWLDEGEAIFPEELEEAEAVQGVQVGEGDALLIRMGWPKRREQVGPMAPPGFPGIHGAAYPWLRQRDVGLILSDTNLNVEPSGYSPKMEYFLPCVGTVAMGMYDVDAADLEELARVCRRLNRWEFMLVVAPLKIHNGTGSPVNPLAVF